MTPRERVRRTIEHQAPDMVPLDLGSTSVTGIHAMAYRALREPTGTGGARGVDTFGIQLPSTVFGFRNDRWKPWRLFDGTEVLVAGEEVKKNVSILSKGGGI